MAADLIRNDDFEGVRRASFILRCWTDTEGKVRLRLIDAHSGVAYPLARLSDLPELIRRLLEQQPPISKKTVRSSTSLRS
jgi:hypothetical protein